MKIGIDKVRANERESSLFELFQRAQPKLNNAVVNWDLLLKPNEIKEKAEGQKDQLHLLTHRSRLVKVLYDALYLFSREDLAVKSLHDK